MQIWIVGLVERDTNRLVLYPVNDRSAPTLIGKLQTKTPSVNWGYY